jgi:ABC-type spermidine/putrescine transport system permease subunit II
MSSISAPAKWNLGITGSLALLCTACSVAMVIIPTFSLLIWGAFGTDVIGRYSGSEPFSWFRVSLSNVALIQTFIYSLMIAGLVAITCVMLTTIYFYTELFEGTIVRLIAGLLLSSALIFPIVVYAVAWRELSDRLNLPEPAALIAGQVGAILPSIFFLHQSNADALPRWPVLSALVLGCNHTEALRRVYLPLTFPLLVMSLACAFALALDETTIAIVTISSARTTIAKTMWDMIDQANSPIPAVIATTIWVGLLTLGLAIWGAFSLRRAAGLVSK